MNAREVKDALMGRHPAVGPDGFVGPWTCLEEWMNIDLLAVCAWASARPYPRYARVGYEVKVSRGDYRRELAKPAKRAAAVAFCHEFYLAVPRGLLAPEEIAWTPPWGFDLEPTPFSRARCPGFYGAPCHRGTVRFGTRAVADGWGRSDRRYDVVCPTCSGEGTVGLSPRERAGAPALWVPADVGLILVEENRRTLVAKKAPRRASAADAPYGGAQVSLSDSQLAGLIRWTSVRPDPRHARVRPPL